MCERNETIRSFSEFFVSFRWDGFAVYYSSLVPLLVDRGSKSVSPSKLMGTV